MGFFKVLASIWNDEKYRANPVPQRLSDKQLAALNIGAINAEQTMYFCDSLTTGADGDEIKENLSEYYGIEDRISALETLSWLYKRGHRVYFAALKPLAAGRAEVADASALDEEEQERLGEYLANIKEALPDLLERKFLRSAGELADISIIAWDMGRLVLVTRCCFEAGYIDEEEAWECINRAAASSRNAYASWREFAAGYVAGRAMWSGGGLSLDGIMDIAQGLLDDAASPWRKYAFK